MAHPAAPQPAPACAAHVLPDINPLIAPLSADAPTGADPREDASAQSPYQRLRDLRGEARNRERQALAEGEPAFIQPRDWQTLIAPALGILGNQAKDLEVCAWLIEAMTRCHGYAGFAWAYELAGGLIRNHGEALHPRPDEDEGKAGQLAALAGLNGLGSEGALIAPLKAVHFTEGHSPAPYSAWQCEQAFELERVKDPARRESRSQRGHTSRAQIDQAVSETHPAFFRGLHRELQRALAAYQEFRTVVDRYCPEDPLPASRIEDTLKGGLQTLRYLAGERLNSPADEAQEPDSEPSLTAAATAPDTRVTDRQSALARLRESAAWFRRCEPHSPVSYAIEQAVYWSELPLPELLAELIPDEGARKKYRTLTGIRT
ncbi:type VI secretion system protein TssA [Alkalilimnicola sp. S0819]|uniref:type VI secretion system protein TssA n=1 Tax=Alkalilimnicola sp. S0819 TaxID=2613922 RepID=UPI0012617233|nr:type VI secretion system protein TssA [Alkalilimnicola sp. S0819]KAB7622587.1 type VI secretion system protein TssA [Alkalilimnicola sp. S0819]MPQ17477.1 type VI secretion system protein TssA [Alkalilimnicola sp. S0819]